MNALVRLLRRYPEAVHREDCAALLGATLREVRLMAQETRLAGTRWDEVVLSTQDGLRLAKDWTELIDEAGRIRSEHLLQLKQCANMERLAVDAKQGLLALALLIMVVPWSLLQ